MNIDRIVCINLKHRKDRKKFMEKQRNKMGLEKMVYFLAKKHKNPKKGCLESHLNIIKNSKRRNSGYALILEDDAKFLRKLEIKTIPDDWDILYLGGTIKETENYDMNWKKALNVWTTHAYIINPRIYDKLITELENYDQEIDRYYVEHIQPNNKCFIINPIMVTQVDGYSDIENKYTNYDLPLENEKAYNQIPHEIINGEYIINTGNISDDNLPYVSIITPTRNRKKFFPIALNNFYNFTYPQEKLEWIIVDDSPEETLTNILPNDDRIKYIRLEADGILSVAQKRNIAVNHSRYDYIVHMDDDDYYFPESILTRIKSILISPDCECIGSTQLGCYDIYTKKSYIVGNVKSVLSEASMAYTKNFWKEKKFLENVKLGEAIHFLKDRETKVLQIPYMFIMIALSHKNNISDKVRKFTDEIEKQIGDNNLYNYMDDDAKQYIKLIVTST